MPITPDPEHRLPPRVLAGLLREQLEVCAVLADRISLARQAAAAGRGGIEEVKEAEDTVRWLQRLTRTILGGPGAGGEPEAARTDVSAAARRTVRRWARTMPDLDVSMDMHRGIWVAVPPTILERILQGLLTTAGQRARRRVWLVASWIGDEVELRADDDGRLADPGSAGGSGSSASDPGIEVLRWLVERSGGSVASAADRDGVGGGLAVRLPSEAHPGAPDQRPA